MVAVSNVSDALDYDGVFVSAVGSTTFAVKSANGSDIAFYWLAVAL